MKTLNISPILKTFSYLLPVLSLKTLNSFTQDFVLIQKNRIDTTENFIETNSSIDAKDS
jgi:hypothetical protein